MKPKFLAPPDELNGVLDSNAFSTKRKKKVKLKLMRREHTASPHILNLKDRPIVQPPKENILSANIKRNEEKRPLSFTIHLDAEKAITKLHSLYRNWKTTLAFLGLGLLCVFGLRVINWIAEVKREDFAVVAQGKEGVSLLEQGSQLLLTNPKLAAAKFQSSLRQFLWAKEDLGRFKSFHLKLLGKNKIDAGLSLARSLKEITVALAMLSKDGSVSLMERIASSRPHLVAALHYIDESVRLLGRQEEITVLRNLISEQMLLIDDVAVLLGRDQWKRYLVLFQNDTELRATGGFIGRFCVGVIFLGKN